MSYVKRGGRPECPNACPPEVYDLMKSCWNIKVSVRPSFSLLQKQLSSLPESAVDFFLGSLQNILTVPYIYCMYIHTCKLIVYMDGYTYTCCGDSKDKLYSFRCRLTQEGIEQLLCVFSFVTSGL